MGFVLYPRQQDAIAAIRGSNAILSAPTGAGKTAVAMSYAGLLDGTYRDEFTKVIFTAPIKALSNERYIDLKRQGFDVGVETGDFKKNTKAPIVCCTQEIYNTKYKDQPAQCVIMDEFHYVTHNEDRARAYIDSIVGTHPSSHILVLSATFGHIEGLKQYLDEIAHKPFVLYHADDDVRPTRLHIQKGKKADYSKTIIHDALVFCFSYAGIQQTAFAIKQGRPKIPKNDRKTLHHIADDLDVDYGKFKRYMDRGVSLYHGGLLPKEKLFVEIAYRKHLIDVVVGSDSLALGVNLPAQHVIFAQTIKYVTGLLTKASFLQMAGRAGRKGKFDEGYVGYLEMGLEPMQQGYPRRRFRTADGYHDILRQSMEDFGVYLHIDGGIVIQQIIDHDYNIHDILLQIKKQTNPTLTTEIDYVSTYSYPHRDPDGVQSEIRQFVQELQEHMSDIAPDDAAQIRGVFDTLIRIYTNELSLGCTVTLAKLFYNAAYHQIDISLHDIMDIIKHFHENEYRGIYTLIQTKKFINRLHLFATDLVDLIADRKAINKMIREVDASIFSFEEIVMKWLG